MDKLVEANQRALDLQYMLDSAQQEVERLRSALAHELDLRNRHIESLEARIKELEAHEQQTHEILGKILGNDDSLEIVARRAITKIERLEAAFLGATKEIVYATHEGRDAPEGEDAYAEKVARDALEKIKAETGSGDHVVGANQLILTAEQREAIRRLIEPIEILLVDHETDLDIEDAVRELRAMLKGYVPVWKATDERIAAMKDACNFLVYAEIRNKGVNPGNVDRAKNAGDVLRTMLEEGKRDA